LSIFDKLLEKIMKSRLYSYLETIMFSLITSLDSDITTPQLSH